MDECKIQYPQIAGGQLNKPGNCSGHRLAPRQSVITLSAAPARSGSVGSAGELCPDCHRLSSHTSGDCGSCWYPRTTRYSCPLHIDVAGTNRQQLINLLRIWRLARGLYAAPGPHRSKTRRICLLGARPGIGQALPIKPYSKWPDPSFLVADLQQSQKRCDRAPAGHALPSRSPPELPPVAARPHD